MKNSTNLEKLGSEKFFVSGEDSRLYSEVLNQAVLVETNDNRIEYCFGDCRDNPIEGEGENYKVIVDKDSLKILYLRLRAVMEE